MNGFSTTQQNTTQYFIVPPPPINISQTVGLILVDGDYIEGTQFTWDEPNYPPATTYPVLAVTEYSIYKGTKIYEGPDKIFSTNFDPGAVFVFHSINEHGEGDGVSVIAEAPVDILKAIKETVVFNGDSLVENIGKIQFYIFKNTPNDAGQFVNGFSINNGISKIQFTVEKNYGSVDTPTFTNGLNKMSYQFSGSSVIYLWGDMNGRYNRTCGSMALR